MKRERMLILGKGAPNKCSDGKITMCAIALTEDQGLIRIYPLNVSTQAKVWDYIEADVDRTPKDSRLESRRIEDRDWRAQDVQVVGCIREPDQKRDILNACVLNSGSVDPITYQNQQTRSIALVKPVAGSISGVLKPNLNARRQIQTYADYQDWVLCQDQFPYCASLHWDSVQGSHHEQKIVAQEVFVGLMKNSGNPEQIWANMRIHDGDYDVWLLLGNLRNIRTAWVVVHVHRLKKNSATSRPITPGCLGIAAGKPNGWPYCEQEVKGANFAAGQLDLFSITNDTSTNWNPGTTQTATTKSYADHATTVSQDRQPLATDE